MSISNEEKKKDAEIFGRGRGKKIHSNRLLTDYNKLM